MTISPREKRYGNFDLHAETRWGNPDEGPGVFVLGLLLSACAPEQPRETCEDASKKVGASGTATLDCESDILSKFENGAVEVPLVDACMSKCRNTLSLVDLAEKACAGRPDILAQISEYRGQMQPELKRLELLKGIQTGNVSAGDALVEWLAATKTKGPSTKDAPDSPPGR